MAIVAAASMSDEVVGDFNDSTTNNNKDNKNLDDPHYRDDDDHEHDMVMPGFRFHPTEEELIEFYLRRKVEGKRFNAELITFLDLYRYDPWELPALAAIGEKEWFFYVPRDRKYRNGDRPNRVTTSGYWKATGADRMIRGDNSRAIGLKKTLVFYSGKAPKGIRTSWIMNEYRLPQHETEKYQKAEISLCRVYKRPGVEDHPSSVRSLPTRANSSSSRGALSESSSSSNKNRPINHLSMENNNIEKMSTESGDGSTTTTSTNTISNNNNSNFDVSIALALSKRQNHQNIYRPMPSAISNSVVSTMAEPEEGIFVNNSVDDLQRLVSYQNHQTGQSNINQQYYHIAHQFHHHHQQQQQQQNALQYMASSLTPQPQPALAMNVLPGSFPNVFSERLWEMWNPVQEGDREFSNHFK